MTVGLWAEQMDLQMVDMKEMKLVDSRAGKMVGLMAGTRDN